MKKIIMSGLMAITMVLLLVMAAPIIGEDAQAGKYSGGYGYGYDYEGK